MNNTFVEKIEQIAETMDAVLMDQMGLMPPEQYDIARRDGRVYMAATFDPMLIGRNLRSYQHEDTLKVLRMALGGLPVVWTQKTGMRYVILASGQLHLPKTMEFPGFGARDVFKLGVSLKGEIAPKSSRLGNIQIGSDQGAGKSNLLKLLAYQARQAGHALYLCDPDGHTFNPDVWDRIAEMPVASAPNELQGILDRINGEIADRAAQFRAVANGGIPPADLEAYNEIVANIRGASTSPLITAAPLSTMLPQIWLFVDETNSYLADKRIFNSLADLLRRGRKWGVHIVLAGHEWHKAVVMAAVNDRIQTRISLKVTNQEAANVVLGSRRWGKWVMGQPAGRGVIRIDQYQPMQFYLITDEMEREWLSGATQPISPLPEEEAQIVRRVIEENEGKMTPGMLTLWGMGHREARSLVERYEARGWLVKDPNQGNARVITDKLMVLLPNRQSRQSLPNPQIDRQSAAKPCQTPNMGGAEA